MKEILKIIYIAVCSAVCLYPIYRWVEVAVDDIRCSYRNYSDSINRSDRSKNKIVRIVLSIRDLWKVMSIFEYGHEYFLPTQYYLYYFAKLFYCLLLLHLGIACFCSNRNALSNFE